MGQGICKEILAVADAASIRNWPVVLEFYGQLNSSNHALNNTRIISNLCKALIL
jgi:hypothetical protein